LAARRAFSSSRLALERFRLFLLGVGFLRAKPAHRIEAREE
jgi:hypothetical protein